MRPHNPYEDDVNQRTKAEVTEQLIRRLGPREADIYLCYLEFYTCLLSASARHFIWPELYNTLGNFKDMLGILLQGMHQSNDMTLARAATLQIKAENDRLAEEREVAYRRLNP